MRLLVCGGAGFIGSAFVRRQIELHDGVEVVCFDSSRTPAIPTMLPVADDPRYTFVQGDICDAMLLRARPPVSTRS